MTFVDTSALYALVDGADANHDRAAAEFSRLRTTTLKTHTFVVHETIALVQARMGLEAVKALVEELLAPISIVFVDETLHRSSLAALLAAGQRPLSFTDWTSFELMRREGIDTAFAFDDHFRRQGFAVLP